MGKGNYNTRQKQRNKPFKGGKRNKNTPAFPGLTKQIQKHKRTKLTRKIRKLQSNQRKQSQKLFQEDELQRILDKNINLSESVKHSVKTILKQISPPKIVALIGVNKAAQPHEIIDVIYKYLEEKRGILKGDHKESFIINEKRKDGAEGTLYPKYFYVNINKRIIPEISSASFMFVICERTMENFLDYCKVADIVGIVTSAKGTNYKETSLDPYNNCEPFDELGYELINAMNIQGVPSVIGLIQHLDEIPKKNRPVIEKLFGRFFGSELSFDEKCMGFGAPKDTFKLLRNLHLIQAKDQTWKRDRGYLLTESIRENTSINGIEVTGFLKGSCISPDQLVHVTGIGDFALSKIEMHAPVFLLEKHRKTKTMEIIRENLVQKQQMDSTKLLEQVADPLNQDTLSIFCKNQETEEESKMEQEGEMKNLMEKGTGNYHTLESEFGMQELGKMMSEKLEINSDDDGALDNVSDVSFQDLAIENQELNKRKIMYKLDLRKVDDLDFTDEAEYQTNEDLYLKYKEYKALKSFRESEWNPYQNLSKEFENIYVFKNYTRSLKLARERHNQNGFVYPGMYIKLFIKDFPINRLSKLNQPLIISSLLKHERKMTIVHMSIQRLPQATPRILKSRTVHQIQCGFRRFKSNLIFSKIFKGCKKAKYEKEVTTDSLYLASMYYMNIFPPSGVMIFRTSALNQQTLVAQGEVLQANPLKVVLERTILTGYPYKSKKKNSIVRLMFFNANDVNYFMPVELWTKNGLRGTIKQSVGTHGYMKCVFNSFIKHNDIICLNLYRRVFPIWPEEL